MFIRGNTYKIYINVKKISERYRYSIILLKQLVKTDFKLRYQGSVLGYTWSLLRPLLLFVILYIVFVKFLRFKDDTIPHYSIYLLLGIVLWNFFAETTSQSLSSIVARGDIIRKIRIPRWTIIISSSLGALINLFFSLLVVGAFMVINGANLMATALYLPLIIIQLYLLALGLSLILSAMYVKYRDISYIWEVMLQGLFYLTPIIYPLSLITNISYQKILLLSPIASAVQNARYALVSHKTVTGATIVHEPWIQAIPYALTALIFIAGLIYFKRQSKDFAENL